METPDIRSSAPPQPRPQSDQLPSQPKPPPPKSSATARPKGYTPPPPIDPQAIPYLESLLTEQPILNDRPNSLNRMYQTQIYHCASRFKGPKISEGYEELVVSQHPLQVIYPDKYHSTGLAYTANSKAMQETHNPSVTINGQRIFCCLRIGSPDYSPMIMYSSTNPQVKQLYRYRAVTWTTYVFMFITIALAVLTYIMTPFQYAYDDHVLFLNQSINIGFDICNLIVCFVSLVILFLAIITSNPKIFLVFIIIFAVDLFINLFRLYHIIQFIYVLSQVILIYLSNYYRVLISPTWYFSQ